MRRTLALALLTMSCSEPEPTRRAAAATEPSETVPDVFPGVEVQIAQGTVRITEIMAFSEVEPDWFEMRYDGDEPVDLGGVEIWNVDQEMQERFVVPPGTVVEPGEHIVVHCDMADVHGDELHAAFLLAREGGELHVYIPGPDEALADSVVTYPYMHTDHAWARLEGPDGETWMSVPLTSPGSPNGTLRRATVSGTTSADADGLVTVDESAAVAGWDPVSNREDRAILEFAPGPANVVLIELAGSGNFDLGVYAGDERVDAADHDRPLEHQSRLVPTFEEWGGVVIPDQDGAVGIRVQLGDLHERESTARDAFLLHVE